MRSTHDTKPVRTFIYPNEEVFMEECLVIDRIAVPGGWLVLAHAIFPGDSACPSFFNTTSTFISDPSHRWLNGKEIAK